MKRRTVVEVLFSLCEIVEERISKDMEKMFGALMYDGWSDTGKYYFAVYALYSTSVLQVVNGVRKTLPVSCCTFLSVSPMGHLSEGDSQGNETTTFNAEVHLNFFRTCLEFYRQKVEEWCICFVGDNASTNLRVARLAKKTHVGCNSHKLNLEVHAMVEGHQDLKSTINSVRDTMKSAKGKLKNAAVLRNITKSDRS